LQRHPAEYLVNGRIRPEIEWLITEPAGQRLRGPHEVVYRNDLAVVESRFNKHIGGIDVPQNSDVDVALFAELPHKAICQPFAVFQSAPRKLREFHPIPTFITK